MVPGVNTQHMGFVRHSTSTSGTHGWIYGRDTRQGPLTRAGV